MVPQRELHKFKAGVAPGSGHTLETSTSSAERPNPQPKSNLKVLATNAETGSPVYANQQASMSSPSTGSPEHDRDLAALLTVRLNTFFRQFAPERSIEVQNIVSEFRCPPRAFVSLTDDLL